MQDEHNSKLVFMYSCTLKSHLLGCYYKIKREAQLFSVIRFHEQIIQEQLLY